MIFEKLGFNYLALKPNSYVWPFNLTPRPTMRTCWLYKNATINEENAIENLALSLKLFWHCLKWDQMLVKPANSPRTVSLENETVTTEILKRRDLAPFGLFSEYLVRKVVVPLTELSDCLLNKPKIVPITSDQATTPKREGLRKRKQRIIIDEDEQKHESTLTEGWMPENSLELCEIKGYRK